MENETAIGNHNSKHLRDGSDFRGAPDSNSAPNTPGGVRGGEAVKAVGSQSQLPLV